MSGPGMILAGLLLGALVTMLFIWLTGRDAPDATDILAPSASNDPYDLGEHAARVGFEFWQNPHASPLSDRAAYSRWLAGWCYGKQQMERK